jgi:hypothetical protein
MTEPCVATWHNTFFACCLRLKYLQSIAVGQSVSLPLRFHGKVSN